MDHYNKDLVKTFRLDLLSITALASLLNMFKIPLIRNQNWHQTTKKQRKKFDQKTLWHSRTNGKNIRHSESMVMTLLIMVDVIVSRNSLVQIIYTSKHRVDIHIPKNEDIHVQINIYTSIICSPSPHIHQQWLFLKRNGSKHKNGTASFSGHDPRTDLSLIYSKGNHS